MQLIVADVSASHSPSGTVVVAAAVRFWHFPDVFAPFSIYSRNLI